MAIVPCLKKAELDAIESIYHTLHGRTNEEAQLILSAVKVNLPLTVLNEEVNVNSFRSRVKPVFESFLINPDNISG